MVTQLVFWAAVGLLFYTYVAYPLLLFVYVRFIRQAPVSAAVEPRVSILVIAHNEGMTIEKKLHDLLAIDYPREALEIVVASDGSSDDTAACVQAYCGQGIRLLNFAQRRGKPSVLNETIPMLTGDIVVLMDARQRVSKCVLRALLKRFADPLVGAVGGELMLPAKKGRAAGVNGVGFYWRYEKFMRRRESDIDSTVGVSGALYAIRRKLFQPIAEDTLLDDVLIPMNIVRQGFRVIFEPDAIAIDQLSASTEAEFARKVRTIAGNFQLFARQPWLLKPHVNRLWLQTFSHKFLRLSGPLLLLLAMASNLLLLESTVYQIAMMLQCGFYLCALGGWFAERHGLRLPGLTLPYTFCVLNLATAAGFLRFSRGQQQVTWHKST